MGNLFQVKANLKKNKSKKYVIKNEGMCEVLQRALLSNFKRFYAFKQFNNT